MMLILVLCTFFSLTACGGDDDGNNSGAGNSGILGTWYYNEVDEDGVEYGEFTFLVDGTGIRYEKGTERGQTYEETYYFAWKVVSNVLYVNWYDNKEDIKPINENDKKTWSEVCQYTISGNEMKMVYDFDEPDSEEDVIVLTRK